ncbi:MAG: bifunctional 4-hydroxy-3-methylbut-2-enyl diphosphate reductase/30S ribosomal protein S1 [Oscillospiraceae bacterium]|nr:bifunctional 4-hydroxy-3-methylbut-2-enyl diphosphate reductase/30S ribosomal protein S1 [Oscillospiraceae bacterium]
MKQFLVAESAGFCFGVRRSVEMAESVLARFGSCLSYGELIHNDDVVSALQEKGMRVIASPSEAGSGDRVIIRAHGVSSSVIDYLEAAGAEVVDATCPRVKHIHRIVSRAAEEGQYVLVIGMRNHPEVEAICGWCGACSVIESEEEASAWAQLHPDLVDHPICVVVQTTQTQRFFKNCVNSLKKRCTNLQIFDTMCFATFTRQNEAAELASRCDAMVVIGGKHSANSLHLAQICQEACPNVQFVERAAELDLIKLAGCETVGLTAGASTPSWIIKEVRKAMDELKVEETIAVEEATEATAAEEKAPEAAAPATETPAEEVSFDAMLEESLKSIYNGEKVTGVVTGISGTEVTVDLGMKYTGFIPTTDFTDAGEKVEDCVKLGDEIEALVVRVNDVEGTAMLSKKRLDNIKFWDDVEAAAENGSVVEGTVTETNKGGVVVNVKGVRVFVPASQTDLPREAELGQLLKNTVKLKITEVNKARKRVVGSIRRAAAAERHAMREELWNTIEVGKRYKGVVKSLTSYGAFVDIGGVDGMVHVSELSWGRIHNPAEVVKVGDELEVYVIGFDKDAHRISLGFKDPEANPWKLFTDQYSVGDVASVKIVKLMQFGAFAEVLPGVDGLIHISQVADHRIAKVDDVLHVGDVVDAKITAIDNENQKISLSIRALLEPEAPSEDADEAEETAEEEAPAEEAAPAEE